MNQVALASPARYSTVLEIVTVANSESDVGALRALMAPAALTDLVAESQGAPLPPVTPPSSYSP